MHSLEEATNLGEVDIDASCLISRTSEVLCKLIEVQLLLIDSSISGCSGPMP